MGDNLQKKYADFCQFKVTAEIHSAGKQSVWDKLYLAEVEGMTDNMDMGQSYCFDKSNTLYNHENVK